MSHTEEFDPVGSDPYGRVPDPAPKGRQFGIRERLTGAVHPAADRQHAKREQRAYGGMLVARKDGGAWKPYKRRRVFLWFFLAVQAIFLIWLITGLHSNATGINPSVVAQCHHQAAGMNMTQAQCVSFLGGAAKTGTALGAATIVLVWVVVDFLLALVYGIYRLARR